MSVTLKPVDERCDGSTRQAHGTAETTRRKRSARGEHEQSAEMDGRHGMMGCKDCGCVGIAPEEALVRV